MKHKIKASGNIFESFRLLKGNTRASVICEPLWGIPFVLFNFYLSLYMKELGVTDQQLGYLISLGFITGTFSSLIAGEITDRLGRKKTCLIFDFIAWPLVALIYFFSNSFLMFAIATFVNSMGKIVGISWNMMVVEDADNDQRVAAFNLLNIINISTGILIPLAGILVNSYGIIVSERIFLLFAVFSMSAMVLTRNYLYRETSVGQRILDERRKNPVKLSLKNLLPLSSAGIFKNNPKAIVAACIYLLFWINVPLGTFNSLYFAPFMTEVLGLGKSAVSILGGVYSGIMLVVFVLVIPVVSRLSHTRNMLVGTIVQILSLLMLILIPARSILLSILCIALYSAGFGLFRPFLDSMFAEVTEGNERARVYSLINSVTNLFTGLIGLASGIVYAYNPRLIYIASIVILAAGVTLLVVYGRLKHEPVRKFHNQAAEI